MELLVHFTSKVLSSRTHTQFHTATRVILCVEEGGRKGKREEKEEEGERERERGRRERGRGRKREREKEGRGRKRKEDVWVCD